MSAADRLADVATFADRPGVPLPLSGETRLYCIVGDPIAQVGSPSLFNAAFRARDVPAVLFPAHVRPEGLAEFLAGARRLENLDGIVVTVPHKIAIASFADRLAVNARRVGAVNVLRREHDGTFTGDMFDGEGCVRGLTDAGHSLSGRSVLLVGAGGAGSAMAFAFADAAIARLRIADLDTARAEAVAGKLRETHPGLHVETGPPDPAGFEVIANATPCGMKAGDPTPVDPERIAPSALVVDVITKPAVSPLLRAAEARGCTVQPGLAMLAGQVQAITDFLLARD